MKSKIKNLGIAILAAGIMIIGSALPSKAVYVYESPETNGIEQRVDKEYGKAKKIRVIEVSGKDRFGVVEDTAIEITYEEGTVVTTQGYSRMLKSLPSKKTIEKTVDGKKITEEHDKFNKEYRLSSRTIQYEKEGAKIEDWFSFLSESDGLVLRETKVEKPTKEGKTVEWYGGSDYYKGMEPAYTHHITETTIYPKGTGFKESMDYFKNQNEGLGDKRFFDIEFYHLIERKVIEEKNQAGRIISREFVTTLTNPNNEEFETRIEKDYELFKSSLCDGKIDHRKSVRKDWNGGVYEKTDSNGDGIPDEEIHKRIRTIYLEEEK